MVVWRAWVLCYTEYKKMVILSLLLFLSTIRTWSFNKRIGPTLQTEEIFLLVSSIMIIAIRIAFTLQESKPLTVAIGRAELAFMICCVLTNVLCTSIISHKAW